MTDAKGAVTYTYDGTDAAGRIERRGLLTKLTVTRAGTASTAGNLLTFAGEYDGDGELVKQTMPGNITQRTKYDDGGEPIERSYSGQVTPVTSSTDVDGNPVYTPSTSVQDEPWLVWHRDNDVQGRVRHEATPDGAAFNADPGSNSLGGVVPNTGDGLVFDRTYTYDGADRLAQVADRTATAPDTVVDDTPSPSAPCTVRTYTFAGDPGLNGNRTGYSEAAHNDGNCTGTATSTHTKAYTYDGADRQTTAASNDGAAAVGSYTYDALGRQTLLPAGYAPDSTKGDVTLGYYDTDLPAWVQQNGTRTSYTLDVNSHRLVSTTGPNGGAATSTTTRHYTDTSDDPAWVDVDADAAGPNPAVTTRFTDSLGGGLAAQIGPGGSTDLTLGALHGDTASTVTLPAAQDESTSSTGIKAWSDYTEYGQSRVDSSTDTTDIIDGPVGYGWLGTEQRSTTPESAGLAMMGDRYYNPNTGRFTTTDPEPGGNVNAYTYPLDPTNMYDLDGHRVAPSDPAGCATRCPRIRYKSHHYRVTIAPGLVWHMLVRTVSVTVWLSKSQTTDLADFGGLAATVTGTISMAMGAAKIPWSVAVGLYSLGLGYASGYAVIALRKHKRVAIRIKMSSIKIWETFRGFTIWSHTDYELTGFSVWMY